MGELTRHDIQSRCAICDKIVISKGLMSVRVFKVSVEEHIMDMQAIQRQAGMEMMMGGGVNGAVLADVMGPTGNYSKLVVGGKPREYLLCQECGDGVAFLEGEDLVAEES